MPGEIAFSRMFQSASSNAIARVSRSNAPLLLMKTAKL